MQNHFQKNGQPLMRRRMVPLAYSQLANLPNSSRDPRSPSYQLAKETLELPKLVPINADPRAYRAEEEPEYFAGGKLTKGSATKRVIAIKVDPDYNPRINKHGLGKKIMLTRAQLKKDQVNKLAMLLDDTPTTSGLRDQKPEQPRVASVRLVPPGHGNSSSVWHSGNVCQHSLDQICNPETRQTAANDVERWRSIESICLHLRGIDVTGDVGILKGPVSFEDVFQVLGLDEEGESLAKPPPPDVRVESPEMFISVDSPESEIEVDSPPIQRGRSRVRRARVRGRDGETQSLSKSPKRSKRRTFKSTYKRR